MNSSVSDEPLPAASLWYPNGRPSCSDTSLDVLGLQNPEEAVWTATEAEEIAVVDRILDYSHMQGETPMAARSL